MTGKGNRSKGWRERRGDVKRTKKQWKGWKRKKSKETKEREGREGRSTIWIGPGKEMKRGVELRMRKGSQRMDKEQVEGSGRREKE